MKQFCLLTLLFFYTIVFYSQNYFLKGYTFNEQNEPIEGVTCVLRGVSDSLYVKADISSPDGSFDFVNVPSGNYSLSFQHMAYEKESYTIDINNANTELPPFILLSISKQLNEVVVSGERPAVKAVGGKLVYDIPQLMKDKSVSTAFETLQNVPSMTGIGDDLKLVGSSEYTILIDGQATSMSKEQVISMLKSMPVSRVSNVEIMYSAPPQYNVRGAAINIIFKEQNAHTPTIQGEGNLEYKQAFYARYGLRGNLLYTKSSFNADLTLGVSDSKGWGENDMYARHQFDGQGYDITQQNKFRSRNKDLDIRLGMGYAFSNKDKLKFVYVGNINNNKSTPRSNTVFLEDSHLYSDVDSRSNVTGNSNLHNLKLEYNSHQKLNLGVDYTIYRDPTTEKYYEYTHISDLQTSFKTERQQKVDKVVTFINHSTEFGEGWQLNYGSNFTYSKNDNINDFYKDTEGVSIDSTNNSKQREYSVSGFLGLSRSFGERFSAQASLSANYYRATINAIEYKKTLWNDFQPFLNVNLTYTHNPKRILQLSFSSDTKYPPYWTLSNEVFRINAYSVAKGNPELKFSKIYKAQINYIMNQKYIVGAYYEYEPDRFVQLPYQSQESLQNVFQFVNLDYEKQYGVYFIVPFSVENVWDTKATVTLLRQQEKDNKFYDLPYNRRMNSFVVQWRNTFNISPRPNIKLDVSGFYMYGALQGIYNIGQMWNVTSGAKWNFLDNRAELMFLVTDVFKSGKQTTKIDFMNQYSTMYIKPNAPVFKLSFTYRFGNYKKPKNEDVDTSRFGR